MHYVVLSYYRTGWKRGSFLRLFLLKMPIEKEDLLRKVGKTKQMQQIIIRSEFRALLVEKKLLACFFLHPAVRIGHEEGCKYVYSGRGTCEQISPSSRLLDNRKCRIC